jgi:flagellar biosynthetic protein FliR
VELLQLDGLIRAVGLHVARTMGLIWLLPIFGNSGGHRMHKLGISIILGVVVATARGPDLVDPGPESLVLGLALARELLFGLFLGWIIALLFEIASLAGALIATEMGLNLANQVNPATGLSTPLFSQLFVSLAGLLFFMGDGPRLLLNALMVSFDGVPPGTFSIDPSLMEPTLAFVSLTIEAGVRVAAPVYILMVVITVGVAFLAKVAPNLHVLEASWPIRILSALLLTILFLPDIMSGFDRIMEVFGEQFQALARGG